MVDVVVMGPIASDESGRARFQWLSPDVFLAQATFANGIHTVECDGVTVELVVPELGFHVGRQPLPVVFSGFDHEQEAAIEPSLVHAPIIHVTTREASAVGGFSAAATDADSSLVALLRDFSRRHGTTLLLMGGGAGGFLALRCGYETGQRAYVLVWNPIIDLVEQDERIVRVALEQRFPGIELPADSGTSFRQAVSLELQRRGVIHSIARLSCGAIRPARLLYLHSVSDPHLARQSSLLIEAAGLIDMGDGMHVSDDGSRCVWFGTWGRGMRPPPASLLASLHQNLLLPQWSATQLKAHLELAGFGRHLAGTQAPLALANRTPAPEIRLSAISNGRTLCVDARVEGVPRDQGQITYAFYVLAGEERIAIRWYDASPYYEVGEMADKPATRVATFVRDGFGRQLPMRVTRVAHSSGHQPMSSRRRVFICGSCVSRDAFEHSKQELHLAGYIARSSLASAFDGHVPPENLQEHLSRIQSAFQRRMVRWDLTRGAAAILDSADWDAVLLDLIDERFSLLRVDGALVTMSGEFMKMGIRGEPENLIPSGSQTHLAAWKRGFARLLDAVGPDQVIVNKVRWATHDDHGDPLERQDWIAYNNATLARMYDHIESVARLRTISYPDSLLVAEREHKWGVSPFHYTRAMYMHTLAELGRLLD